MIPTQRSRTSLAESVDRGRFVGGPPLVRDRFESVDGGEPEVPGHVGDGGHPHEQQRPAHMADFRFVAVLAGEGLHGP